MASLEKGPHNDTAMWGDPKGILVTTFIPLPCSRCSREDLSRCCSKDSSAGGKFHLDRAQQRGKVILNWQK